MRVWHARAPALRVAAVTGKFSFFFLIMMGLMQLIQPSLAFRCGTPVFKAALQNASGDSLRMEGLGIEGLAPTAPVHPAAPALPIGTERTFFAPDFRSMQQYTVPAVLRGVGQFCYVYVEETEWERRVTRRTVDAILRAFEETTPAGPRGIYATVTELFGAPPDVDANGRVILLLLNIRDRAEGTGSYTAGFFNPADQGRGVLRNPGFGGLAIRSNVADMLYIDTFPLNINGEAAHNVIAHELQHLIHWRQDSREAIWVDEGCADYAAFVCGYLSREHIAAFEKRPSISLTNWPDASGTAMPHYGAAFLWMLYLHERYGGVETLRRIVKHRGTSMDGIAAVLAELGRTATMADIFSDWKVANYVSDYRHVNLALSPTRVHRLRASERGSGEGFPIAVLGQTLPDFAAAYLVFEWVGDTPLSGLMGARFTLGFSGETPGGDTAGSVPDLWGLHVIEYVDDVTYTVAAVPLMQRASAGTGSVAVSEGVRRAVLVPSLHSETRRISPRTATYEYSATRGANITFVAAVIPNPVLPQYWDIVAMPSERLVGLVPTVTLMQGARLYREAQPMKALQVGEKYRYTFHLEPEISPDALTWELFLDGRRVGKGGVTDEN